MIKKQYDRAVVALFPDADIEDLDGEFLLVNADGAKELSKLLVTPVAEARYGYIELFFNGESQGTWQLVSGDAQELSLKLQTQVMGLDPEGGGIQRWEYGKRVDKKPYEE